MKPILALILLSTAMPALADWRPGEDAAHHADRLYTESLNQRAYASAQVWQRANDHSLDRYRQAQERFVQSQARYEQRRAEWQRQVADCRSGDWGRCD